MSGPATSPSTPSAPYTPSTSKSTSTSSTSSTSTSTSSTPRVSALLTTLDLGNYPIGSTIGVAILDSGLQDDGNFTGRISEFDDFTTATPTLNTVPYDDYGHGTHIAGLGGSNG